MIRHFAFLAILLGGAAFGQVTSPSISKVHRPLVIEHETGAKVQAIFAKVVSGAVVWESLADEHFVRRDSETIMVAPVGEYVITTGDSKIVRIVSDGTPGPGPPDPQPKPEPKPEPNPQPEPSPDKLNIKWVIWLEEQSDRSAHTDETQTMLDPELWSTIKDMGAQIRLYDDDQPNAAPFKKIAADKLPAMILMEAEDRYLVFPAPKSSDEAEALIRRHAVR